jgi:hypothetical protein
MTKGSIAPTKSLWRKVLAVKPVPIFSALPFCGALIVRLDSVSTLGVFANMEALFILKSPIQI